MKKTPACEQLAVNRKFLTSFQIWKRKTDDLNFAIFFGRLFSQQFS